MFALVRPLLQRYCWFRAAMLSMAQRLGDLRYWLHTGWRPLALVYFVSCMLLAGFHWLNSRGPLAACLHDLLCVRQASRQPLMLIGAGFEWLFQSDSGPWLNAIGLGAILIVIRSAWRIRSSIVILSFANVTGDDTLSAAAAGLARRLMTEMAAISDIFETVKNEPPELSADLVAREAPKVIVDSATDPFGGLRASLSDRKLEIGPIKIPLDAALTTMSNLVRGPRLLGSLQKLDTHLVIEASLQSGASTKAWRVTSTDLDPSNHGSGSPDPLSRMIRQLAYRIFTDLRSKEIGTPIWRAVECYTCALRACRDAAHDRQRRLLFLRRAQRWFFDAYSRDRQFQRSLYNLGIMYYNEGEYITAYQTFAKLQTVSARSARTSESGYAEELCNTHYAAAKSAQGALSRAKQVQPTPGPAVLEYWEEAILRNCTAAANLNPLHALARNLPGLEVSRVQSLVSSQRCFREATAIAWWNMCVAAASSARNERARVREVSTTLGNLAKSLIESGSGLAEIDQLIRLDGRNPSDDIVRGQIFLKKHRAREALEAFEQANRKRDSPVHWFWIGIAMNRLAPGAPALAAFRRCIENPSFNIGPEVASLAACTSSKLPDEWIAERQWLEQVRECTDLKKALAWDSPGLKQDPWRLAQVKAKLCELQAAQSDLASAESAYSMALNSLGARLSASAPGLCDQLLESTLAQIVTVTDSNSPDQKKTLLDASDRALRVAPMESRTRLLRGVSLQNLRIDDSAQDEFENALTLAIIPAEVEDAQFQMAGMAFQRFQSVTNFKSRQAMLKRLVEIMREMAESKASGGWNFDPQRIGELHFNIGRFSFELFDLPAAQASLEIAVACSYQPFTSLNFLCLVHFRAGALEEAERTYQRVRELAMAITRTGNRDTGDPKTSNYYESLCANHTSAAIAEQGLCAKRALKRWREGRALQPRLGDKGFTTVDRDGFAAAQCLALGAILLADASDIGGVWSGAGRTKGGGTQSKRIRRLAAAIACFRRVIARSSDVTVRADALYRVAVAFSIGIEADPPNAEQWQRQALEFFDRADDTDQRNEYAERITKWRSRVTAAHPAGTSRAG